MTGQSGRVPLGVWRSDGTQTLFRADPREVYALGYMSADVPNFHRTNVELEVYIKQVHVEFFN